MSFVQKYISLQGDSLYAVKCYSKTKKAATYFMIIQDNKLHELKRQNPESILTLENYGQIVTSCYGHEITDIVRKELKEKYNFELDI